MTDGQARHVIEVFPSTLPDPDPDATEPLLVWHWRRLTPNAWDPRGWETGGAQVDGSGGQRNALHRGRPRQSREELVAELRERFPDDEFRVPPEGPPDS
jgi:hypothetical protein